MRAPNKIDDKSYVASFTMEQVNAAIPNQRIYLKGVNFLTDKILTGIRHVGEFMPQIPDFGTGTTYNNDLTSDQFFAINLVQKRTKTLTVNNLPVLSFYYQRQWGRKNQYTPFNDVYDFDNSWLEKLGAFALTDQVIFLEFRYRDKPKQSNGSYTKNQLRY